MHSIGIGVCERALDSGGTETISRADGTCEISKGATMQQDQQQYPAYEVCYCFCGGLKPA